MSQSLSNLLVHLVFSTKKRGKFIRQDDQGELYAYIASLCEKKQSPLKQIGGMPDHLHLLVLLSRSTSLAKLVTEIKANSSRWLKTKGRHYQDFAWQNGYGAFSIGQSSFQQCVNYISNQEKHHKKFTFQEELLELLKKYQVSFDEQYLWD